MRKVLVEYVPALVGGAVGGVAGSFVFYWIWRQGFYALVIPGALAGLGCGLLARTDSAPRGILCALEALIAGLVAEWLVVYSPKDVTFRSFLDFAGQLKSEPWVTLFMLALGTFLGFWWGRECTLRGRLIRPAPKPGPAEE